MRHLNVRAPEMEPGSNHAEKDLLITRGRTTGLLLDGILEQCGTTPTLSNPFDLGNGRQGYYLNGTRQPMALAVPTHLENEAWNSNR